MKVRKSIYSALFVLGLICWLTVSVCAQNIPALLRQLHSADRVASQDAAAELRQLGRAVLPDLLDALQEADPIIRESSAEALAHLNPAPEESLPYLFAAFEDKYSSVRRTVVTTLAQFAANADAVIPYLNRALKDPDQHVRFAAVKSLSEIAASRKDFISSLAVAFDDPIFLVREAAIEALTESKSQDPETISALLGLVFHPSPELRIAVVEVLGQVKNQNEQVIQALAASLRDRNENVRAMALKSLKGFGLTARSILPQLISMLRDKDTEPRRLAVLGLKALGSEAEPALAELVAALRDKDRNVAVAASRALGAIGPVALPSFEQVLQSDLERERQIAVVGLVALGSPALQNLRVVLKSDSSVVRKVVVSEVSSLIPDYVSTSESPLPAIVLPLLLEALRDTDKDINQMAVSALRKIRKHAIANLHALLEDRDTDVQKRALEVLTVSYFNEEAIVPALIVALRYGHLQAKAFEELVRVGVSAFPALADALKTETPETRKAIVYVLSKILSNNVLEKDDFQPIQGQPDKRQTLLAIRETIQTSLKDEDYKVRRLASLGLGKLLRLSSFKQETRDESDDRIVAENLIASLQDQNAIVRAAAVLALTGLSGKKDQALASLTAMLGDPDPLPREAAARVLYELQVLGELKGEPAKAIVLALTNALQDSSRGVRVEATLALSRFHAQAAPAVPALIMALKDSDPDVQLGAMLALAAIGTEARPAIPSVLVNLKRRDLKFRKTSIYALGRIGQGDARVFQVLITSLADSRSRIRCYAANALGDIGPQAKAAIPYLQAALRDKGNGVRWHALAALAKIGTAGFPILKRQFDSKVPSLRAEAVLALAQVEPEALAANDAALRMILDALADEAVTAELYSFDYDGVNLLKELLQQVGSPALPVVKPKLNSRHPAQRAAAASVLSKVVKKPEEAIPELLIALDDEKDEVRIAAAIALVEIGKPSISAILQIADEKKRLALANQLLRHYRSYPDDELLRPLAYMIEMATPASSERFTPVVIYRSSNSLPQIVSALKDPDVRVRRKAVSELDASYYGSSAGVASAWILALKDSDDTVGQTARRALLKFGRVSEYNKEQESELEALLIEALGDKHEQVRSVMAEILGLRRSTAAGPALTEALTDSSALVRQAAALAFSRIGLDKNLAAVMPLIASLKDVDPEVRLAAVQSLAGANREASRVVLSLAESLREKRVDIRRQALRSLAQLGEAARSVVSDIIPLLSDDAPRVREAAAYALSATRSNSALPYLTAALLDNDDDVAVAAARSLARFGPGGQESVPQLITALNHPDRLVRKEAANALRRINSAVAVSELRRLFQSEPPADRKLRIHAVEALAAIGPEEAATLLSEILGQTDPVLRHRAALVAGRWRALSEPLVPALTKALGDSETHVRAAAADSLGKIGAVSPTIVPSLVRALNDRDYAVRVEAAESLGELGVRAHAASPALIRALGSTDRALRQSAAESLGQVNQTQPTFVVLSTRLEASQRNIFAAKPEPATLRALRTALKDPAIEVRLSACQSLATLGAAAQADVKVLTQLRNDPQFEVCTRQILENINQRKDSRDYPSVSISNNRRSKSSKGNRALKIATPRAPLRRVTLLAAEEFKVENDVSRLVKRRDLEKMILAEDSHLIVRVSLLDGVVEATGGVFGTFSTTHAVYSRFPTNTATPRPNDSVANLLPNLPWPPPQPSTFDELPRDLVGADNEQLYSIYHRLTSALERHGYEEHPVFEIPDGFALVTRLERLTADGTPDPNYRWTRGKVPASFYPSAFLSRLLWGEKEEYRMIVFAVTTRGPQGDSRLLAEKDALQWLARGWRGRDLPGDIGRLTFGGRRCYALVYHFIKEGKKPAMAFPSRWNLREHFEKARLWETLNRKGQK